MSLVKTRERSTTIAESTASPLSSEQVLRASKALIGKITSDSTKQLAKASKTDLLADGDDDTAATALWLILTTKKHITDKKRLKPGRIALPHPYIRAEHSSDNALRVCLITADPQRKYKDLVEDPAFPLDTSKSIARVIGLEKLKAKYHSFESKRQLLSEYDVFLADDRIITYLPGVLGKVFYKSTAERPIPITLEGRRQNFDAQGNKRRKLAEGGTKVVKADIKPQDAAAEIEKALGSALVHLAPSTSTAVKCGTSSMEPNQVQENIEAIIEAMVDKYVPQKWPNVRAIHVKGPNTIALPIWLADELWVDQNEDVREKALPAPAPASSKRKRALTDGEDVLQVPGPDGKMRQVTKPGKKVKNDEKDENATAAEEKLAKAARKEALKQQKEALKTQTTAAIGKTKRMKAADFM